MSNSGPRNLEENDLNRIAFKVYCQWLDQNMDVEGAPGCLLLDIAQSTCERRQPRLQRW